jgi:hypothetical protein
MPNLYKLDVISYSINELMLCVKFSNTKNNIFQQWDFEKYSYNKKLLSDVTLIKVILGVT